jgi:hypothetical protein
MIKATELRIGNVFRGIGGIQTVLSLEENTDRGKCNYSSEHHRFMYSHLILCHQNGNQYKPFEIEPIHLTEEILLKCGFEKCHNYLKLNYSDSSQDYILYDHYKNDFLFMGSHARVLFKIKSLHELQNLYFALTGKELVYSV